MPKEDIGLILLGVGSAFGVWSALNTSPVGTVEFGATNPEIAQQGMMLGAGIIGVMSVGIWCLYGDKGKYAALATGLTGAGLFIWYQSLLAGATPVV